jgi:hypothetical protein
LLLIKKGAFQIFVLLTHPFEYTSIRNCFAPPQEGMKKLAIADAMKSALSEIGNAPVKNR